MAKEEITYEKETCSRCHGTGRYSFNMRDGNRCWGCKGSGLKLTRDGAIAKRAWKDYLASVGGTLKNVDVDHVRTMIDGLPGAKIIKV